MNNKLMAALTTIVFVTLLRQLVINAQSPQLIHPFPKSSILQTSLGRISDSFSRKISSNRIDILYLANKSTFLASAKEEEQFPPTSTQRGGRR